MQVDFPALLRSVVRCDSVSGLADTLTGSLSRSRSVALVRFWFLAKGGGLELRSSAGTPSGGGTYSRLDGEFREMAVSDARIAEVAATGEPIVVRGLRGDEDWLINPSWAARQGVRAFVALPLVIDHVTQGVVALFDREMPNDSLLADLQLTADIAAARIYDLRRVTPSAPSPPEASPSATPDDVSPPPAQLTVVTREELRHFEKQNIEAALAQTGGKIFGADGAAALLGMKPTTLASRMKALGIR